MMKKSGSRASLTWVMILAAVIGVVGVSFYLCSAGLGSSSRQRLERLLAETDYAVLLEACRDLSSRVAAGDLRAGTYRVRSRSDHAASRFPDVILDIEPRFVIVTADGRITLEMFGYPDYGVIAYPEGSSEGLHLGGNVKLIPGLWYYDEDYEKHPERKRDIDALIKKGRRRNAIRGDETRASLGPRLNY